jgi:uncharacterized membrane protein (Fun14 family)
VFQVAFDPASIGTSLGIGGIAGFLIGYAIKKVIKIMMVITGLFLAALLYLSYQGILTVNWDKLEASATAATTMATSSIPGLSNQIMPIVQNFGIPLTGSFAGAFVLGFMKG